MTTQQQSKLRQAKRAQPVKNVKKKITAERWKLYRTIEERTLINYQTSQTPYADTYRKALARVTDELLCLTTEMSKAVKLRTQELTTGKAPGQQYAVIKLYIYLKA